MKHLDTLEKSWSLQPNRKRWRLWTFVLLAVLVGTANGYGQISWETGYPKMGSKLTIEGEFANLEVSFTASSVISDAKIELTLPSNISFDGISDNGGTVTSFGTPDISGSKATIPVSLASGSIVKANIQLKAARGAKTGDEVTVQLLSATSPVAGSQVKTVVEVQTPAITITATAGKAIVDCPTRDTEYEFEYNLKSINGKAKDFKLVLTVDEYLTLGSFEYGGDPVMNIDETGSKIYTLTLEDLDETTGKKLIFKAKSSRDGSWPIKSQGVYPSTGTACSTTDGATLTLKGTDVAGKPYLSLNATITYLGADNVTPTDWYGIQMNGTTPSLMKIEYKNTGTADAWEPVLSVDTYSSRSFINRAAVQYQIGNGPVETLGADKVTPVTTLTSSSNYGYFSVNNGKARSATVSLPEGESVGINQIITYWIPVYNGATYDNGVENVYSDSPNTVWAGYTVSISSKNSAGVGGGASPVSSSWVGGPHFRELPGNLGMKPGSSFTQKIRVSSGTINSKATARVYIQLPSWLELDGANVEDAIVWTTTDEQTIYSPVTGSETIDPTNRIYSLQYNSVGNTSSLLSFKYKVVNGSCSGTNLEGAIRFWMNYEVNGTELEYISQVKQAATLLCNTEGITLDEVSLKRITRGLRDSDENHLPDNKNEDALDAEMNHSIYMTNDEGEMQWKGTIVGTSYSYLYLPVTVGDGMTMGESDKTINYQKDKIKVTVDGTEKPVPTSLVYIDDTHFYILLYANLSPFTLGQEIGISLPFIANKALATSKQFISECFVSNTAISNPFDPNATGREGKDFLSQKIATYGLDITQHWNSWKSSYSFTNNNVNTMTGDTYHIFYNNPPAPYFEKEIRYHAYPSKIIWEVPDGYLLSGNLTVKRTTLEKANDGLPSDYPANLPLPVPTPDGNTYEFDLQSLYDFSYEEEGDAVAATKWVLPEDKWGYSFDVDIQATKGAQLGRSPMYRTIIYKTPDGGETTVVNRGRVYLDYSGVSTTLSTSISELSTTSPKLSIPVISFGNPNTADIQDNWLYVSGNVSNLSLKPIGGGSDISGAGYEGRWLDAGTTIEGGKTRSFTLDFDYTARTDGKNDTIWVYTASGFATAWSAPTSSKINLDDADHVGARKMIVIKPAAASVSGSFTVTKQDGSTFDKLEYNAPYKLVATISSRASSGMVSNPSMSITIPAGQEYTGTASVSFGSATPYAITGSALETALTTNNSDPVSARTAVFNLKDIVGNDVGMPGASATSAAEELLKEAVLTLELRPMCNTDLKGIRFGGEVNGSNGTGTALTAQNILSGSILADVNSNYGYAVTVESQSGRAAFNELQTTEILQVTVRRNKGTSDNVNTTDSLLLILPEYLDINGTVNLIAGTTNPLTIQVAEGTAAVGSNEVKTGNKREIRLSIPANSINSATNKGFNQEFVYQIPVKYTPSGQDLIANALHPVQASMVTSAQFGTCGANEAAIGSGDLNVVLLTTKEVLFKGSVGSPVTLEITTTNFTGDWYNDELKTNPILASGLTHTFTPASTGTERYYVEVKLGSDATSYGMLPVDLQVYPSLIFTVSDATICNGSSVDLSTLLGGDATTNGSLFTYYQSDGTTSLTGPTPHLQSPGSNTTYYVESKTSDGSLQGAKLAIDITVSTPVSITTASTGTIYVDLNGSQMLSVTAAGDVTSYQWYKDGVELTGETGSTYMITNASSTHEGIYTVTVLGCNNVTSSGATIIVCPTLDFDLLKTSDKFCDQWSVKLWDYIDSPNTTGEITYYYDTAETGSYGTQITNASTVTLSEGLNTFYIKSKNQAETLLAQAKVLVITARTSMSQPTAVISASELEVSSVLNSTASVTVTVSGVTGTAGAGGYLYRLYDSNDQEVAITGTGRVDANAVTDTQSTHTFTLTFDPATEASSTYSYYVTVEGACGESLGSSSVSVTVYPAAELTLAMTSSEICEDNSALLADIGLWDYIDTPNSLLTYTYKVGGGSYQSLSSSTTVAITGGYGSYTYTLKAENANGSESSEETVTILVEKKTVINSLTGYEVTEGDPVIIAVSADGEPALDYEWQKLNGGIWQTIAGLTGDTETLTSSAHITENGDRYRVIVTGQGLAAGCNMATREFVLNVKSRTTPPLGNNKVTWTVVGYGNAGVTADGISISNGSHVNDGAKLTITGTTWMSNVLKSITINGTEYTSSPVSYTVNGGDVTIVVEFLGSDPNPDPNANAEIEDSTRIWTEGGYACIYTESAMRARIITFNGRLVTDQKLMEGESRIQLPDGYYIVTLSDGTTKKIAIRNF